MHSNLGIKNWDYRWFASTSFAFPFRKKKYVKEKKQLVQDLIPPLNFLQTFATIARFYSGLTIADTFDVTYFHCSEGPKARTYLTVSLSEGPQARTFTVVKGRRPALFSLFHWVKGRRPALSLQWRAEDPHSFHCFTQWRAAGPHFHCSDSYNTYTRVTVISPCELWDLFPVCSWHTLKHVVWVFCGAVSFGQQLLWQDIHRVCVWYTWECDYEQVSQVTYRGQGDTGHNQRQAMKVRTRTSEKAKIDIQRALKSRQ